MQTSRVTADVTTAGRRRRGAPSRSASPTARRTRPARRARAYARGPARFVTGVAVIIALGTAAFGVEAYVRAGHQQTRITALRADLTRLEQRVTADEHGAAVVRRRVRSVAAQASSA